MGPPVPSSHAPCLDPSLVLAHLTRPVSARRLMPEPGPPLSSVSSVLRKLDLPAGTDGNGGGDWRPAAFDSTPPRKRLL